MKKLLRVTVPMLAAADICCGLGSPAGADALVTHRIPALLAAMRDRYHDGRASVVDGLRVDWPDRWFHVRVSQTEPVVRIICEQRGEAPRELYESLVEQVRSFA